MSTDQPDEARQQPGQTGQAGRPDQTGRSDDAGEVNPDDPGGQANPGGPGGQPGEAGEQDRASDRGGAGPSGGRAGPSRDRGEAARPTTGATLAQPARTSPPRPPRRTGVFVDPDDLREHVGALLRAILGGYEVDAFGNYTFVHEGARIFVTVGVSPFGPHVGVFSVTNLDVDLTTELGTFLLTTNHRLGYGAFSYDPTHRAVWLRHTLLGTTLDVPELQAALAAVSTTAAELDDRIRDRFGGRRFQDVPSELQQRMEPPQPSDHPPPNAGGYL